MQRHLRSICIIIFGINILFGSTPLLHPFILSTPLSPHAVEFIALEARQEDQLVILNWSTASETQNAGFILERKGDSLDTWDPLADYIHNDNLLGQGTVSTTTEYSYIDSLVELGGWYYYRISGIDIANNIGRLDSIAILVSETAIRTSVPSTFSLSAYPNPFNPRIAISVQMTAVSRIELDVYDLSGKKIETLVRGVREAGNHVIYWDASGESAGIYLAVLRINEIVSASQKMLLVK